LKTGFIGRFPIDRDQLGAFAIFANLLAFAAADGASNFGRTAALLALADVGCFAVLHHDDFADVALVPRGPLARAIWKFLPDIRSGMAGHLHVLP